MGLLRHGGGPMRAAIENWEGIASWAPWWDVAAIIAAAWFAGIGWAIARAARQRRQAQEAMRDEARRWRYGGTLTWHDDQNGAVAVEAAIILPILLLLIIGGLDVGLMVLDAGAGQYAAQQACPVAAAGDDPSDLIDANTQGGGWSFTVATAGGTTTVEVVRVRPAFIPAGPSERTVTRSATCLTP